MKIMWTREAFSSLENIKRYIAKDSSERAAKFIEKIINQTDILISNPYSGRIVPEISQPDIRELIYQNYRIVYRISGNIEILTVFEGHKLLRSNEFDE